MSTILEFFEGVPAVFPGVEVAGPCLRPGAPEGPFKVLKGVFLDAKSKLATGGESPYLRVTRKKERGLAHHPLVAGDVIQHFDTGVIAHVVEKLSMWEFAAEAWRMPNGHDDVATERAWQYWKDKNVQGDWFCLGFAVWKGQHKPSWFPWGNVQVRNIDVTRPTPEDYEFTMDVITKGKTGLQPKFKEPLPFEYRMSKDRIQALARKQEQLKRGIFPESENLGKMDEHLDSVGDTRILKLDEKK